MIAIYLAGWEIEKNQQDYLKIKSRMHWSMNPSNIEIIRVVLEEIDTWFLSSNLVGMPHNQGIGVFKSSLGDSDVQQCWELLT